MILSTKQRYIIQSHFQRVAILAFFVCPFAIGKLTGNSNLCAFFQVRQQRFAPLSPLIKLDPSRDLVLSEAAIDGAVE